MRRDMPLAIGEVFRKLHAKPAEPSLQNPIGHGKVRKQVALLKNQILIFGDFWLGKIRK